MRTFVIGDIHGAYNALIQCLDRSGFDRGRDRLIALGDVCDGYPDVKHCIDELLAIKHCDYIIGNHDLWALQWAEDGTEQSVWLNQGGANTIASYGGAMPAAHAEFLRTARAWVEYEGRLFVHGGLDPAKTVDEQDPEFLVWDRSLVADAWNWSQKDPGYAFPNYKEIYVGHTPTQHFTRKQMFSAFMPGQKVHDPGDKPLFLCNVIMMDTGAGWSGRLTIMDIDSRAYWQSDPTPTLYNVRGRG